MTDKQPWIRLRTARPILKWFTDAAISEIALAVHVLPDDVLGNRDLLTACLREQLLDLNRRKAEELTARWQAEWEKEMAGKFVDLPGIQN
jgi:hypothetical protein